MSEGAQVTICLLTYNRREYAEKTLRCVLDNIVTSHPLGVHIADDGSDPEYTYSLRTIAAGYSGVVGITNSNSARGGYGKNVNLATQAIHGFSRYVLMLEDDWELARPLDLDNLIEVLDTAHDIGCIRLGYLGYTQELRGRLAYYVGAHYLILDPDSAEPHVFAGHPRLESTAWQRHAGPWIEGLAPGATEFHMAKMPASRRGVAWPLDIVHPRGGLFKHIGSVRSY